MATQLFSPTDKVMLRKRKEKQSLKVMFPETIYETITNFGCLNWVNKNIIVLSSKYFYNQGPYLTLGLWTILCMATQLFSPAEKNRKTISESDVS